MDGWEALTAVSARLDLRSIVEEATLAITKAANFHANTTDIASWLLSRLLLPVREQYVQEALNSMLKLEQSSDSITYVAFPNALTIFPDVMPRHALTISKRVSAERILSIIALLRVFLNDASTERAANEVIAYYATSIGDDAGEHVKDLSLDYLAEYWQDESNELRQASRLLFGTTIGRMSDHDILQMVESRQACMLQETQDYPKELLVLGEVVIARSQILNTATVRDVADQVARAVESTDSVLRQSVALELLIRGFGVFQHWFDAVRVLRSVFKLATSSGAGKTQSAVSSTNGLRNLSRQAILSIAAVNAPLFMSVLASDAAQPDIDPEERASTMRLIAFMVRKVGTSLLGMLTPAGPPPQGHGSGSNEPYKTLDFKLASPEEAMMTAAAQLEWLVVDWLDDRRVKISIRETALTFSVM
ncbi:hypothetical protein EMMF5_004333 [Cystobasidiomycetes sp. EMM_F5]